MGKTVSDFYTECAEGTEKREKAKTGKATKAETHRTQ